MSAAGATPVKRKTWAESSIMTGGAGIGFQVENIFVIEFDTVFNI